MANRVVSVMARGLLAVIAWGACSRPPVALSSSPDASSDARNQAANDAGSGADASPAKAACRYGAVKKVTVGANHNCVLFANGRVSCWGANDVGQLGDGSKEPRARVVEVDLPEVTDLWSGYLFSCALNRMGRLTCWGSNSPRLELAGAGERPQTVDLDIGLCLTTDRHTVHCSSYGWAPLMQMPQLDVGDDELLVALNTASNIACTTALSSGSGLGVVRCARPEMSSLARRFPGRYPEVALDPGGLLAIDAEGSAWRLSLGGEIQSPVARVGSRIKAVRAAKSGHHHCALTDGGEVWCWGANDHGQLGDGTTQSRSPDQPVRVHGFDAPIEQLALGFDHVCALSAAGTVWCWGAAHVGRGTMDRTENLLTPTTVAVCDGP